MADHSVFTAGELLVAEALIELLYGPNDDDCHDRRIPPLRWGRRRRRSVLDNPPSPTPAKTHQETTTPSPKTPLCFTPSESETTTPFIINHNRNHPNKYNIKIEQLLAQVAGLSKNRLDLTEALNKVRTYYEKKERERSALHHFYLSRLQQSMSMTEEEAEPIRAVRRPQIVESEPSTSNQTATIKAGERNKSPQRPQAQLSVRGSPNALPDLSISVVISDVISGNKDVISSNKAVCAENRKRRYEINRDKRFKALAKQQRC
ncbi:hypothetical protein Sjap_009998 [Stephania japonica]|uniref:Uncharacterized protein n=1 Tax=Stephania japonica TaxID=461633 RepID=A0AAP0JAN6_9MAGN